ncbi:MAG: pyridoxal 5'-phosphate synthase glutaminase subunit PdxT [Thermoplasmata archaeon]
MIVGVLAIQGDVPEHRRALLRHLPQSDVRLVRDVSDLDGVDALFLPGGESTAIAKLLIGSGMWARLAQRLDEGMPALGTCAGLILLARSIEPSPGGSDPPSFERLDVTVRRNDYGPQRESFEGEVTVKGLKGPAFPGIFIRSPKIVRVGPDAEVIARRGGEVVGVREGPVWGLTFHPELSDDPRLVGEFLRSAKAALAHRSSTRTKATTTMVATSPATTASQ